MSDALQVRTGSRGDMPLFDSADAATVIFGGGRKLNTTPVRIGIIGCGEAADIHAWFIQHDPALKKERESPPQRNIFKRGLQLVRGFQEKKQQAKPITLTPERGIEGVQIIAASDIDKERLAWFCNTYDIPHTYIDYREVLARKDVDAVLICTPPSLHAEITVEASRYGKHIFCQKPMAMTSEDCIRMIKATKEAGVVLQIGYVLRFSSERGRIREAILNKEIGRPVFLREIGNLRAGARQRWVHDQELGGGLLWEYSHGLDFLRHVFGDPDLVFGIGGRYKPNDTSALDTISVLLTFPSGDQALFTDSYAVRGFGRDKMGIRRERLQIDVMGPGGFIQYPDGDLSQKLTICVYGDPEDRVEKIPWSMDWGANGYKKELEHFLECVREGKQSNAPGEEGLRTIQLIETVLRSVRTGEVCKFRG